jgi:hypothetical protein
MYIPLICHALHVYSVTCGFPLLQRTNLNSILVLSADLLSKESEIDFKTVQFYLLFYPQNYESNNALRDADGFG